MRAKNKASERAGKNEGRLPALSLAFFYARAPLSERLEQARGFWVRWLRYELQKVRHALYCFSLVAGYPRQLEDGKLENTSRCSRGCS